MKKRVSVKKNSHLVVIRVVVFLIFTAIIFIYLGLMFERSEFQFDNKATILASLGYISFLLGLVISWVYLSYLILCIDRSSITNQMAMLSVLITVMIPLFGYANKYNEYMALKDELILDLKVMSKNYGELETTMYDSDQTDSLETFVNKNIYTKIMDLDSTKYGKAGSQSINNIKMVVQFNYQQAESTLTWANKNKKPKIRNPLNSVEVARFHLKEVYDSLNKEPYYIIDFIQGS